MTHETKGSKGGKLRAVVAIGAIAAAGYYFYASKKAKENRKNAARWAQSFKREVLKQLENAKELNRESIAEAVDQVVTVYQKLKSVDTTELKEAARELKDNWQEFAGEVAKESTRSVRVLHRGIKRAWKQSGK